MAEKRPRTLDTNDMQVGQPQSFDMPASGPLDRSEFRDEFKTVDTPNWKEKAKNLAFAEQMVEIVIQDSDLPNAEQIIEVRNGGISQFFFRGKAQWVKRKFVEVLARAKQETITTPEYTDATGSKATRINKIPGLRYPFRILTDTPEGHQYLERILREG